MDDKVFDEIWSRWDKCSLCEQAYHGVVACALGWAAWKTYLGRPEGNDARRGAMYTLGNGLFSADRFEEAVSVEEANVATLQRIGAAEEDILATQGNLATTYRLLGRYEQALQIERDVYSGWLKLDG